MKKQKKLDKILIVDDDNVTRTRHNLLVSEEYETVMAEDAKSAIQILKEEDISLVLLDYLMPEINGVDACMMFKQIKDVPVIFITAIDSLEDHLKAYEAGAEDLIIKPVQRLVLNKKIKFIIDSHKNKNNPKNDTENRYLNKNELLFKFFKKAIYCKDREELALLILDSTKEVGLNCAIRVHMNKEEELFLNNEGFAKEIEKNILNLSRESGDVFQLKNRLVLNKENISLFFASLPVEYINECELIKEFLIEIVEFSDQLIKKFNQQEPIQNIQEVTSVKDYQNTQNQEKININIDVLIEKLGCLKDLWNNQSIEVSYKLQNMVSEMEGLYSYLMIDQKQELEISRKLTQLVSDINSDLVNKELFDKEVNELIKALKR